MTEEEMKEMKAYLDYSDYMYRTRPIKAIFERGVFGNDDEDRYLIKWFVFCKILVCLLLRRTNGDYFKMDCWAVYDFSSHMEGQSWMGIWANAKITDWTVCVMSDGN